MVMTGSITLTPTAIEEFFNDCHSSEDGRFCGGPGGGGRVREIKSDKTKEKVLSDKAKLNARKKQMDDISNAMTIAYVVGVIAVTVAPVVVPVIQSKLKQRQINKKVSDAVANKVVDTNAKWASVAGTGRRGTLNPGASKRAFRKLNADELDDTIAKLSGSPGVSIQDKAAWNGANSIFEIEAKDGTKLYLVDQTGKTNLFGRFKGRNTIKQKEILNSLAFAHESAPLENPPVAVLSNDTSALGWTMGAKGHRSLFISSEYIDDTGITPKGLTTAGWHMPAADRVSNTHYTVIHEYGHRYDYENGRDNAAHLFKRPQIKRHLSGYANYEHPTRGEQPWEGYAESFADWHASAGTSRNPSTIAYANDQGWFGTKAAGSVFNPSDGRRYVRTPEGARKFGVAIGQPIPEGIIDELSIDERIRRLLVFAEFQTEEKEEEPTSIIDTWKEGDPPLIIDRPGGGDVLGDIKVPTVSKKQDENTEKELKRLGLFEDEE